MSGKPETVVHVAARMNWMEVPEEQLCADCGFTLWHGEPGWPGSWTEDALVGVRIDTTFKDGFVIGFFPIGDRELEPDERRCTVGEPEELTGEEKAAFQAEAEAANGTVEP